MHDPEQKKGKGNFIGKALGFTSFQDRVERMGKLMQALNLAISHEVVGRETKIRQLLTEYYKALDIDPQLALKTADEKTEEARAMMRMQLEEENRVIQLQETMKNRDHQRELDKEGLKGEIDQLKQEQKFTYDLLLKVAEKQGVKEAS